MRAGVAAPRASLGGLGPSCRHTDSMRSLGRPLRRRAGLDAVAGLGDDLEPGLGLEDLAEAGAHECLVVGDQDADVHDELGPSGSVACSA